MNASTTHAIKRDTAAAALAAATMLALATNAYGQTEKQIQTGCNQASGIYSTGVDSASGDRISYCCYHDYKGKFFCDFYVNGDYQYTFPNRSKAPPPVTGPKPPPADHAPLPTGPEA